MTPHECVPAGKCCQRGGSEPLLAGARHDRVTRLVLADQLRVADSAQLDHVREWRDQLRPATGIPELESRPERVRECGKQVESLAPRVASGHEQPDLPGIRSDEHTSELQSLMRISYAVFCL